MKTDLVARPNSSPSYFTGLSEAVGQSWNRFWFTPSDPFTLCVIRVLTAIVALGLYLTLWPDLHRFFGPEGLLSRDTVLQLRDARVLSVFDYATSEAALNAFYWIGAVALALFLLGLLTRVTSWLALLAFLSILHRGPMIARPAEDIVAMLMAYLCLGPSGAALSLDSLLRGKNSSAASKPLLSWTATLSQRLMQVHVGAIYAAMAIAKLKSPVWWNGTAVWGLVAKSDCRLVDLTGLADPRWIYVINAWTLAIVLYEACFAVLIWNRWARPILFALGLPVWLGTALLTGQVSWVLIMLVANLAFVSPEFLRVVFGRREN
jgi:hypothetical protein